MTKDVGTHATNRTLVLLEQLVVALDNLHPDGLEAARVQSYYASQDFAHSPRRRRAWKHLEALCRDLAN